MKIKKFLSVAFCLLIGVCAIVFVACGKQSYSLLNLYTDYSNTNFLSNDSSISYNNGRYLFNINNMSNNAFRSDLSQMETLNYNLSTFLANNISYSTIKGNSGVSNENRDKIHKYLNDVKSSLKNVDKALANFELFSNLQNAEGSTQEQNRESLQIFYDKFNEEVYNYFVALSNLSNTYYVVYFNNYYNNINTNYYNQYVNNNVDVDGLSNSYLYNARVDYQIFNTTQIYLIENWHNKNLDNSNFNAYASEINSLLNCKLSTYQKFEDAEPTHLLAVQMYNCIALLDNDYQNFAAACDALLNSSANADNEDNLLAVKNYKSKVYEFNKVLVSLYKQAKTI